MDLEGVWRQREEEVYPALFGTRIRGFLLQAEMFTGQFSQAEVDPRWLHHGVFEFGPTEARRSWLYVTSGHSSPWDQLGIPAGAEFTFATTEAGEWAIRTLQSMLAFDILLWAGRSRKRVFRIE